MARFFIDRPIFAWVVAIFIMLAGLLAIPMLPIAQYPNVAPPQISVSTSYPGASPEDIYQSVTRPIEEELNGVPGLIYFESTSESSGRISINVTFEPGTNIGEAQVEVQNRIARVEPRLPRSVTQQGLRVEQAGTSFLMMVALTSVDGNTDAIGLGDYLSRNVLGELRRVPGVGSAQLFATQRSMRIWMDPDKMLGLSLTSNDVISAIQAQNSQVAAGRIGASPNPVGQQISATVNVQGQLTSPEEFGSIVLRANPDGSSVRLRDVARVEVGGESYNFSSRLNGKPSAAIGVQLSPTGNALQTSEGVRATMEELSQYFPQGIEYEIPYDTSPFVKISIEKVIHTLIEAIILVFIVMFVFLQNIRYTIIPTLVVPVALLGTCAIMYVSGFSINVLTMFAMVLAIGILVDDAIVVVENVERIMHEEGLSPKEATKKSMAQISGALVGIGMVLSAVFLPMAFFGGSVGVIYKQFSITIVSAMALSVFVALTLTPAMCATILKPGHARAKRGPFAWFNRAYDATERGYARGVGGILKHKLIAMVVFAALVGALAFVYGKVKTGFLPEEDQGTFNVQVLAPPGATQEQTRAVMERITNHVMEQEKDSIQSIMAITGFGFGGRGQNSGLAFVRMRDWKDREDAKLKAQAVIRRSMGVYSQWKDAIVFAFAPPAISELGNVAGFQFQLQDRAGLGHGALVEARDQLLGLAAKHPALAKVRQGGLEDRPEYKIDVDQEKAAALGLSLSDINQTLAATWGGSYINDFLDNGRTKRVYMQADAQFRMQPDDLGRWYVRNRTGEMVPFTAFASGRWTYGSPKLDRFNGFPTIAIQGEPAPGHSSGEAMAAIEQLVSELPDGIDGEWTGLAYEERQAGSNAWMLYALSLLVVFLCLAALYESWSIPVSVMLVVPLGVLGAVLATMAGGQANDVYFQVGLLATMGLAAKNAILIVEFAKELVEQGKTPAEAALQAARMRLRPIIMTSLAFVLGVTPLAIASGAGAGAQNAIGIAIIGGVVAATVLGVLLVPVFFVLIVRKKKVPPATPVGTAVGPHA